MELDEMLNGTASGPEETSPPEAVAAEEAPAPEVPAGEPQQSPAAPPAAKPSEADLQRAFAGLQAGITAERSRRQELERELAEARKQHEASPPKSFYDDPEGTLKTFQDQLQQQVQQVALQTRMQTSEMIARNRHPDFDQYIQVFGTLAQRLPGLYEQFLQSADPGEFAYQQARAATELAKVGSVDKLREQLRAEVRAELEKEMKTRAESEERNRSAIPPPLPVSGAATTTTAWTGPPSLSDIIR